MTARLQRWVDAKLADGAIDSVYRVFLRHGALCDARAKAARAHARHGRCRFREMDRLRRDRRAFRRALSGRAKAARCWPSSDARPRLRSQPVRLGARVAALRGSGTGGRPAHQLDLEWRRSGRISRRTQAFAVAVRRRQVADLVFTGRMDYRPNIDAVHWFAREVMPVLRLRVSALRGSGSSAPRRPPRCSALADLPGVQVTGPRAGYPALSCRMPMSWWHRCASLAASRTSCWRRWRWRDRWLPHRKHLRACVRSRNAIFCWPAAWMKRFKGSATCSTADMQRWAPPRGAPSKPRINWSVTLRPLDRLFVSQHDRSRLQADLPA